jgi:hypothetical protein
MSQVEKLIWTHFRLAKLQIATLNKFGAPVLAIEAVLHETSDRLINVT